MPFENDPKLIRAPKLSEQVAEFLIDEIKTGSLGVGEKLPSEADLCSRFGVSRTIIREAIGRLEYDGYLEAKRGRRAQVTSVQNRRAFRITQSSAMDAEELAQLYELRMIIESAAVALAAQRCNSEVIQKLEECIHNMEEEDRFGEESTGIFVEFHQIIAEASGNGFLSDFMVFLNDKIGRMMQLDKQQIKRQQLMEKVHAEHYAIYRAIRDRDVQAAKQMIQEHIYNAARRQGVKLGTMP